MSGWTRFPMSRSSGLSSRGVILTAAYDAKIGPDVQASHGGDWPPPRGRVPVFFGILGSTVDTRADVPEIYTPPSAEKHMCIVLALEARRGPNTQDQAGRLLEATGHLFLEVT